MNWTIRTGGEVDAEGCHAVYVDAIRNGTAPLYSAEQAHAWAPSETPEDWLPTRLRDGVTWIAEAANHPVGFLTVTETGHLDFFFVRPDWRGSGVAAALYDELMGWAASRNRRHLTTFASHLARSFLERRGWCVLEGETAVRNGVELKRWKMEWRDGTARKSEAQGAPAEG